MIELLTTGPETSRVHILLAHGAGAPMTSPFMDLAAGLLVAEGLRVSRFEFQYMARRRISGKRTPPPKAERLIAEFEAAVALVELTLASGQSLVIGGKSMGGRVASSTAAALHQSGRIAGLVCLGYPFHPPGKPEQLRTAHLTGLNVPTLIVQGERDPFGARDEVEAMQANGMLSPRTEVWWAADGDHDLGPRGNSGTTRKANHTTAMAAVAGFCREVTAGDVDAPASRRDPT